MELSLQDDVIAGLRYPDVYFTPGYGRSAALFEHGGWHCANLDDAIILPYVERALEPDTYDAISPYGYCGIHVSPTCPPADLRRFWAGIRAEWLMRGITTMFFRFSPMDPHSVAAVGQLDGVELTRRGDTVLIPVHRGAEHVWSDFQTRSRTAVRKAGKAGMTCTVRPATAADVATGAPFRLLYASTMGRVGGAAKYLFSDGYFHTLRTGLDGALSIAEVLAADGSVVSAALLLSHGDRVHYHLAGSDPESARLGANNLLIWTVLTWSMECGARLVHLGGGVRPDDGLFTFKKSFGAGRGEFWTGSTIVDQDAYERLTERQAIRLGTPARELHSSGFFPAYRTGRH